MLGNQIEKALSLTGVTPERVSRWLGVPCHCKERQEKLNALDTWVRRVLSGRIEQSKVWLNKIIGDN